MDLYSAKANITSALADAASLIDRAGVHTGIRIYFEESDLSETDEWSKKSEYIVGELTVYTDNTQDEDGLVYLCSVGCKGKSADANELSREISEFMSEVTTLKDTLDKSENAAELIDEHIRVINAEGEKMIADFDEQIKKTRRISMIVSAIGIGVILLVSLSFLLF